MFYWVQIRGKSWPWWCYVQEKHVSHWQCVDGHYLAGISSDCRHTRCRPSWRWSMNRDALEKMTFSHCLNTQHLWCWAQLSRARMWCCLRSTLLAALLQTMLCSLSLRRTVYQLTWTEKERAVWDAVRKRSRRCSVRIRLSSVGVVTLGWPDLGRSFTLPVLIGLYQFRNCRLVFLEVLNTHGVCTMM